MKNITFYNLRRTDFQEAPLCDFKSATLPWKSALFFSLPGAGPGADFGKPLKISDSTVKRQAQLQDGASASHKSLLLYFFSLFLSLFLLTTIPFLTQGKHMFFQIINIFRLGCFGWPQFLPKILILLCCSFLDFGQRLRASTLRRS